MKFTQTQSDGIEISIELPEDATLDQAIAAFESFLKSCGYHVPGELDFQSKGGI